MRIFLDTEFTGLQQNTTLISIGLVAENGEEFYAEFTDYDRNQITDWIKTNVIDSLKLNAIGIVYNRQTFKIKGNRASIVTELQKWLSQFDVIEVWSDVLAYDWILFCELFGGAMNIPDNIFYAPFDLATLFRIKGLIEPKSQFEKDISRFDFVGYNKNEQHNALADARVEKACFEKLTQ